MKEAKKKIGDILMEEGLITSEQLETTRILQKTNKKRLGKILIELGHVTEEQLAGAVSKQFSLPMVDWKAVSVDKDLLSLVPREVAEKRGVFPLALKKKELLLAMADPLDLGTMDYITFRNGLRISVAVCTEGSILDAIEKYYGSSDLLGNVLKDIPDYEDVEFVKQTSEDLNEVNAESLIKLSETAPVVKLVTTILVDAVKSGVSDVHIEPRVKHAQVRYRIDGKLRDVLKYPKNIHGAVVSRIKIISRLDISIRMRPQDGRSALRIEDRGVDLRISTLPSVHGEKVVIRLLDQATGLVSIDKLGIPDRTFKRIMELISKPQGMILITGPTGSGKSTTLYAMLRQLRSEAENIITVEDPVEFKIGGITQVQANEATGLTFPVALRSFLRQDPDIIMVGEIRDRETAEIALRAAVTGHLVFSTVHTNDTVSTVTRLLDIGIPPYLTNASLIGVLAQRLVRKICPNCKTEIDPPEELLKAHYPSLEACFKGTGCDACQYTGYKGRMGVYEFLEMNSKFKEAVANFTTEDSLWEVAKENGIVTLFDDAWDKVNNGITTFDEVIAKIHYRSFKKPEKKRKGKILQFAPKPVKIKHGA
jgi:type IV pilus assembly protein PilB